MAGNKLGGQRASATNKERYGEDYYKKIGSKGGRAAGPKGFALMDLEKVKAAGRKGGSRSKRTGVTTGAGKKKEYYYTGDGRFANVQESA